MSVNLCAEHWAQPLLSLPHCSSPSSPKVSLSPRGGERNMDSQLSASFYFCFSLPKRQIFKNHSTEHSFFLDNTEWIKNMILCSDTFTEVYHVSGWFDDNNTLISYRHCFQGAHGLAGKKRHRILNVCTSQPQNLSPEPEGHWHMLASFRYSSAAVFLL